MPRLAAAALALFLAGFVFSAPAAADHCNSNNRGCDFLHDYDFVKSFKEGFKEGLRKPLPGLMLGLIIWGLGKAIKKQQEQSQKQQGFALDIRLPRSWEYRRLGSGYDLQRAARDR